MKQITNYFKFYLRSWLTGAIHGLVFLTCFFMVNAMQAATNKTDTCNTNADFTYVISGKTIIVTSMSTGTGQLWYNWTFDGQYSNNKDSITYYTFDSAGTYQVCLVVDAGCGADSICKTITISDSCDTKADFTYVISGNKVTITSTSTGTDQLWYTWQVNGAYLGDRDSVLEYTFDSTGVYDFCLIVDANCGADMVCKRIVIDDSCDTKADFTYTISGNKVVITSTSTGTGQLWHNWEVAGSYIDSRDSVIEYTFDSAGVYDICLVVDANCGYDRICKTVTIDDSCDTKADFTYTVSGNKVTITSTSAGTGQLWHNWEIAGSYIDSRDSIVEYAFDSAGVYDICLVVDANCGYDRICKTVTIDDDSCDTKVDFTYAIYGNKIIITSTSTGTGKLWYNWQVNGNYLAGRDSVIEYAFDSAGTYEFCLIVDADCGADKICKTITIDDTCDTKADFTYTISGNKVTITSTSTGTGQLWHNWQVNGSYLSERDSVIEYTFDSTGDYEICLVVDAQCGADRICKTISMDLGLNASMAGNISIYPNPTNGKLNIASFRDITGISLMNAIGDVLYASGNTSVIDLSDLPSGIYLLKVTDKASNVRIFKILKQ